MNNLRKLIRQTLKEDHYTTWKKLGEVGPLQYGENLDEANPIDSFQNQQYEIAQKLSKKFNIGKFAPLGSGTSGFAYYIPNNRVLKITKDKSEVVEAHKIKGKKLKHLANIYDTFILWGKYEGTYVIISELLDKTEDIDDAHDFFNKFLREHYNSYVDNFLQDYRDGDFSKSDLLRYENDIHDYLEPYKAKLTLWYMNGMMRIIDELKANKIISTDYGTTNLGIKKDGSLAMYDFGYGDTNMPAGVQDIHLNEKQIEEHSGEAIPSPTNHEYPDFFDGQNNPLFANRAYPPVVNINDKPLSETEISSEEINKKELPYKFSNLFQDFLFEKTEAEIREIAPTINLQQNPHALIIDMEKNYPSLFDTFAQWIFDKEKSNTTFK